ncbi:30S ribosomal protein S9 [Candidatus Peribacteria bacterium RIFCSPHIGHO2_01_FULL_55_13]|nr:MAG: 30S ribosomal protein S9 [Candidatus Peribacteria bacterium RIFCSPHIGHO2_01_FULL_55_13]OGJ64269.1 MAG: 30S ribosomal protein S9 [Candidatus Peribacteria bacterium RIFCSPHIGHO2_12_FULL_55_11]
MTTTSNRQYFSAIGKRKTSIAHVKLFQDGSGTVTVNGLKLKEYLFGSLIENAIAPLKITDQVKAFDVEVTTKGGGKSSQSDAIRHGISRTLLLINPDLRVVLKRAGFLRRDARIKERKKPGLKRARKAPQFSKR